MSVLQIHADAGSGGARSGKPDPTTDQLLLPAPAAGMVRVPLWGAIQSDGPEALVSCHAILRRAPAGPGWLTDPTTCILWAVKLTPPALRRGEWFLPVPLLPLPEGWELIASWSYATGAHALRTRAVSVEVPAAGFDWTRQAPRPPFSPLTIL